MNILKEKQKLYRIKQINDNYYLDTGVISLYCGNYKDARLMERISYLILAQFFDVEIARMYHWYFGTLIVDEYGGPFIMDGRLKMCGITIGDLAWKARERAGVYVKLHGQ